MDLEKIYKERLVQNLNDQQQKIRITSTIGNLRVILFLLMVFLIIKFCGSNFETMYYWWSFLAVVPVFALLVKVHQKHIEEKEIIDQLVQINEKELLAIETNQAQFDDGKEYTIKSGCGIYIPAGVYHEPINCTPRAVLSFSNG